MLREIFFELVCVDIFVSFIVERRGVVIKEEGFNVKEGFNGNEDGFNDEEDCFNKEEDGFNLGEDVCIEGEDGFNEEEDGFNEEDGLIIGGGMIIVLGVIFVIEGNLGRERMLVVGKVFVWWKLYFRSLGLIKLVVFIIWLVVLVMVKLRMEGFVFLCVNLRWFFMFDFFLISVLYFW